MYMYMYVSLSLSVCMCVCVWVFKNVEIKPINRFLLKGIFCYS